MQDNHPDIHHDHYSKTIFGFWCYLISDFMMFATFFAAYAVLKNSTFGGPSAKDICNIDQGLMLTLISLTASFISGLGGVSAHREKKGWVIIWFFITLLLSALFMAIEFQEWGHLIRAGHTWKESAFLSMFFTLVGMHALHMFFAFLWTFVVVLPLFFGNINGRHVRRITCLKMFWQFINIIWLFIFTIVYLIGGV